MAIPLLGFVLLWCLFTPSALAQGGAPAQQSTSEGGVPVMYRGREILRIHRGVGGIGPAERARLTSERLNQLVREVDFDPSRVTVNDRETHSELTYDDSLLGIITDQDAEAVGRLRPEHAREAIRSRLAITTTSSFA